MERVLREGRRQARDTSVIVLRSGGPQLLRRFDVGADGL